MLSLQGLNRLSRHVITNFIRRAPTELDTAFDYTQHLPGIVKVRLAPEYWIHAADGFTAAHANDRLGGLIDLLCPAILTRTGEVPDLNELLNEIERLLPGEARLDARRPMVAIYLLWHQVMKPEHHRAAAHDLLEQFGPDLDDPSVEALAVRLLLDGDLEWPADQIELLVDQRTYALRKGKGLALPSRIDAAILLLSASNLWVAGDEDRARSRVGEAVELLPGDEKLLELERVVADNRRPTIDLHRLAIGAEDWLQDSDGSTDG